eukprot:CAMPEP_0182440388 /NCGR_PEP_ID=MMETSP1167-20130531/87033_1 /TAXON_ID=2988 /ORGANISM="Mallomonas Sp, Strain CCMP3275" /LENGTH=389 /DNA_ID=CAMNT_0024634333 /DNA_START=461 /DNA_END=1630 /DNA_ORIENTATION=-
MEALGSLISRSLQPGVPAVWRPVCRSCRFNLSPYNDMDTHKYPGKPINTAQNHLFNSPSKEMKPKGNHSTSSTVAPYLHHDYPVSWPDGIHSRAHGSTLQVVKSLKPLIPISGACVQGYVVFYRDVSGDDDVSAPSTESSSSAPSDTTSQNSKLDVMACYNISTLLKTLCPGVGAVMDEVKTSPQYCDAEQVINPFVLYGMMTQEQRQDPLLAISQVEGLASSLTYLANINKQPAAPVTRKRSSMKVGSMYGSSGGGASLGGSTGSDNSFLESFPGNTMNNTGSSMMSMNSTGSTRQRAVSPSKSSTTELTEKRLRAFDVLMEKNASPYCQPGMIAPEPNEQYSRMKNWENVKTPEMIARAARKRSSQERASRSNKVMNRLHDLSNLFE